MLLLDNKTKIKIFIFLAFLVFSGCTLKPTKVYESQRVISEGIDSLKKPLKIDESVVVVDVRSLFEYSLAHLPNSISIQWDDFSRPGALNKGLLSLDLNKEARRLAAKGISPEKKIIIVGKGLKGNGEEGRLAWTFMYLGILDVQFASLDHFANIKHVTQETPPLKSVKTWVPKFRTGLLVEKAELENAIKNPIKNKVHLIDVRSAKEFFSKKGDAYEYPNINAIQIPWDKFFTSDGRPNLEMSSELLEMGIQKEDRIILISQIGLRSGAVAASLNLMGFKRVGNFSGGYNLLSPL
jgi:thiosulfate/3-mercaptopyruvate sulfurtransferase